MRAGTWAGVLAAAALAGCTPPAPVAPPAPRWEDRPLDAAVVRYPVLERALKEQAGKVVLVDFWATWCAPCVESFPHLVATQKKYLDRGLVCMAVNADKPAEPDPRDRVLAFLRAKDARFPNFILDDPAKDEPELKARFGYDGTSLPLTALFDRDGERVWTSDARPRRTAAEVDELIERTLAGK